MSSQNVVGTAPAFGSGAKNTPCLHNADGLPIISLRPDQAAESAGIPRVKLYAAIKNGELAAHKCGRSTLIEMTELVRWVKALPRRVPT